MKSLPWILAAVGLGVAAYVVTNTPAPEYATGNDDIENAARKTSAWGSKNRITGTGTNLGGKLKEGLAEVKDEAFAEALRANVWEPVYLPYRRR